MLSSTLSGKTYTWTTNNIDLRKLNHILDLFHIISCIMFFASFLYFHVHFLSCSYTVHVSYTFISQILSYNLSYTILYFYLHSYTFHIRCFCVLSSVFHLFLVFFIFQFYDLLHSMSITYIISYHVPISCLLSCSGYTPMLYYSFLTYCFIIYFLIRTYIVIYFTFAFSF